MRTLFSFTHTSHARFFDRGGAQLHKHTAADLFFACTCSGGHDLTVLPSPPAFLARTKHGTHIRRVHQHLSHGRFQDAIKMETEDGRRSVVGEELSNSESCLYFSTLMYWLGPTFLLNDFGKPFKKHIKGLCSA